MVDIPINSGKLFVLSYSKLLSFTHDYYVGFVFMASQPLWVI